MSMSFTNRISNTPREKEWLKSPGTNLQRLDQVSTNVYNFGLSDTKSLKATPGSLIQRPLSSRIHSAEDLSALNVHKPLSSWGSQNSLSGGFRSRPESAKVSRVSSIVSGRKSRPHTAKATVNNGLPPRPKPKIAVKGAQFEPGERPSGGLNYIPGSAGWVAPPSDQEMTNVNSALQQFINGQDADIENVPPAPLTTPTTAHDAHVGLHPHEARNMLLKSVLKPPRRDPIQLPTATYDDDDDLEDDPGDDDYDDGEEEQYEQLYTSADFSAQPLSSPSKEVVIDITGLNVTQNEADKKLPPRSVRFAAHHTTVDITPRDVARNKLELDPEDVGENVLEKPPVGALANSIVYSGQRRLRHVRSRTNSGLDLVSNTPHNFNRKPTASPKKAPETRPSSAKTLSTVSVTYINDLEDENSNLGGPSYTYASRKKSRPVSANARLTTGEARRRSTGAMADPPTMMSAIDLSDEEPSKSNTTAPEHEKTKYVSKPMQNYSQMSADLYNKEQNTESVTKTKTVKTFELTPGADNVNEIKNISEFNISGILSGRHHIPDHLVRPPAPPPVKKSSSNNLPVNNDVKSTKSGNSADAKLQQKAVTTTDLRDCKDVLTSHVITDYRDEQDDQEAALGTAAGAAEFAVYSGDEEYVEYPTDGRLSYMQDPMERPKVRKKRIFSAPVSRTVKRTGVTRPKSASHADKNKCTHTGLVRGVSNCTCSKHRVINNNKYNSGVQSARRNCFQPPVQYKSKEKPSKPQEPVYIWTRKDDFEIETQGVKDCKDIQRKLLGNGLAIPLETLTRGLLAPTEYSSQGPGYYSTGTGKPKGPNSSAVLLSKPSVWLPEEHRRVVEAKKAVRLATAQLLEQEREERLERLRELGLIDDKKKKKKKRKGKGKSKTKRIISS